VSHGAAGAGATPRHALLIAWSCGTGEPAACRRACAPHAESDASSSVGAACAAQHAPRRQKHRAACCGDAACWLSQRPVRAGLCEARRRRGRVCTSRWAGRGNRRRAAAASTPAAQTRLRQMLLNVRGAVRCRGCQALGSSSRREGGLPLALACMVRCAARRLDAVRRCGSNMAGRWTRVLTRCAARRSRLTCASACGAAAAPPRRRGRVLPAACCRCCAASCIVSCTLGWKPHCRRAAAATPGRHTHAASGRDAAAASSSHQPSAGLRTPPPPPPRRERRVSAPSCGRRSMRSGEMRRLLRRRSCFCLRREGRCGRRERAAGGGCWLRLSSQPLRARRTRRRAVARLTLTGAPPAARRQRRRCQPLVQVAAAAAATSTFTTPSSPFVCYTSASLTSHCAAITLAPHSSPHVPRLALALAPDVRRPIAPSRRA
jgi:hypothetical protein